MEKNESNTLRGLHIVVLHPNTGKVVTAKVFDTYAYAELFDDFVTKKIPDDHIIIAACKDDCVTKMSE